MKRRVSVFAMLGVLGALPLGACSSRDSGELVIIVTTDLSMPADIDWLDWIIVRPSHADVHGSLSLSASDSLPGTLAVISGKDGEEPVQITLNGRIGGAKGTVRVTREARLNMPIGQKMLQMPLTWLCSDGNQKPDCAVGTTCQAGRCVDSTISAPLADFAPLQPAQCFNVLDCTLKGARSILATPNIDATTGECIIDSNSLIAQPFNVALQINPGTVGNAGVCSPGADGSCFVMLNQDDTPDGWQLTQNAQQETVVRLPIGVWDAVGRGSVQKVALTHNECPLKTSKMPVCDADPACLVSPSSCPDTFPDTWVGYSCSGAASPSDNDSKLKYCGISDSDPALPPTVPGHFCCTAGQATPSTALLIDDMSGGPLIKFPPPANQFAGSWFTASDDNTRPLSPPSQPGTLFTYRDITTVKPADEPSFDRAACFKMSEGFAGYYALEGFSFSTVAAKSVELDVSPFAGISFWAMVKGVGSQPPPTIGAYFPNRDTDTEHNSTCIQADVPGNTGKSNCSHFRELLPALNGTWQKFTVKWDDANFGQDPAFGMQFPMFDPHVYSVDFEALGTGPTDVAAPFDFCVSQIYFVQ